ncbi:nucleotide sugar dehydrogenase [archaeon]|jgi:UDP-N-acetyl-D-glucosamine dehydrogenase|nr:nucleotide sugar dehydrogenase [archaeon]MBT4647220.1 nucleotide sugar dehydrogenase [archaeon]MBT5424335.1 nucleotide sugar dehydrogenase [archaeon]
MKIGIIGLGYVGLPLAILCAEKKYEVIGYDIKTEVVDLTNKRVSHINDKAIQNSLKELNGDLTATTDPEELKNCEIFIICVPTPVDKNKEPDLKPLEISSKTISKYLKKGDLVIVESTVFPGTCEEIVVPILEESGLQLGVNLFLAHCPERVNPGDIFWETKNIPRVVGALSKIGVDKAAKFYQSVLGGEICDVKDIKQKLRPKIIVEDKSYKINTIPLGTITKMNSIRDAEAVKAMENTVRDVNIAFVNELAKISEVLNLDVIDIIDGMTTKPFGKGPFYPGIGVGGHCIAVDPEWLKAASIKAGFFPKIIQHSRDTNNSMPNHTIRLLEKLVNLRENKVAVLGVTYKGNIDDPRESPFYDIKKILLQKKVDFSVFDPWYRKENTVDSIDKALDEAKIVLLVTNHDLFKEKITVEFLKAKEIKIVIDGRNCLNKEEIIKQGIVYKGIGR